MTELKSLILMIQKRRSESKKSIPVKTNGVAILYPAYSRIAQIAAAEDEMRAEGKIDNEGHLKKVTHEPHTKKSNGKKHDR
jgi:hypothetical protein